MFAIVEISGEQFKIEGTTKKIRVPYQKDAEVGQKVNIENVILTSDDAGKVKVGGSASISASVAGHTRGEKVVVFKKKRRKGYRVTNGHTQPFTELNIEKFSI